MLAERHALDDRRVRTDPRVVFDDDAARDLGARGDDDVPADAAVVRDVDVIVDLRVCADRRRRDRARAHGGEVAHFDVRVEPHRSDVRDPDVVAVGVLLHAESLLADHRVALDERPRTDTHAPADHDMVADLGIRVDDHSLADDGVLADARARVDHGGGVDARGLGDPGLGTGGEVAGHDLRERSARVVDGDRGAAVGDLGSHRDEHDRARPQGLRGLLGPARRIDDERQQRGIGFAERSEAERSRRRVRADSCRVLRR